MVIIRVQAHDIGGWKQKVDVFEKQDEPLKSYKQRVALFEKQASLPVCNKAPSRPYSYKTLSGPSPSKALSGLNPPCIAPSGLNRCKVMRILTR